MAIKRSSYDVMSFYIEGWCDTCYFCKNNPHTSHATAAGVACDEVTRPKRYPGQVSGFKLNERCRFNVTSTPLTKSETVEWNWCNDVLGRPPSSRRRSSRSAEHVTNTRQQALGQQDAGPFSTHHISGSVYSDSRWAGRDRPFTSLFTSEMWHSRDSPLSGSELDSQTSIQRVLDTGSSRNQVSNPCFLWLCSSSLGFGDKQTKSLFIRDKQTCTYCF